jgi:hypothetical protein
MKMFHVLCCLCCLCCWCCFFLAIYRHSRGVVTGSFERYEEFRLKSSSVDDLVEMVLHHARHRHQRRGRERRAGGRSDATPRGSGGGGGDVDDSGGGGGRRAFGILTRLATTIDEEVTEEELNQIRRRFEDFRTGAQHRRSAECEGLIPASVVALARGPSSPSRRHRHCVATVAWGAFFSTWALASYLMYLCEHDYEIERRRSFIESMRQEEDSGDLASWDSNDDHRNGGGSPPNPDAAEAKSNEFFAWLERYGGCPSEEAAMDPELFWDCMLCSTPNPRNSAMPHTTLTSLAQQGGARYTSL